MKTVNITVKSGCIIEMDCPKGVQVFVDDIDMCAQDAMQLWTAGHNQVKQLTSVED